jgi:predicted dienelactone hydrolase
MYYLRSLDMSQSIDAMSKFTAPDPLAGKIATDKVLLVGHSFGTHTVWGSAGATFDVEGIRNGCHPGGSVPSGVCTEAELAEFAKGVRDERIVAGIPMAGSLKTDWFGAHGQDTVKIPLLQMTGSDNDVGAGPQWDTLKGVDISWIDILGGCHETFNLGSCATLDMQVGYSIVDTYALAFARYHVLGDRDATVTGIVDGSVTVSPLVTYKKR